MPRVKKFKPRFQRVIDTREQLAWEFGALLRTDIFEDGGTVREGLAEGDYAARLTLEDGESVLLPHRVERKSHVDLCGVIGFGRERFERELDRLRPYRADLIIEASLDDILRGHERSQISGRAVAASLASFSIDYGVFVWFCESRRRAAGWCARLLEEHAQRWFLDKHNQS
jgi:ERCC4-type nuclease